jgi:hypothetical protein
MLAIVDSSSLLLACDLVRAIPLQPSLGSPESALFKIAPHRHNLVFACSQASAESNDACSSQSDIGGTPINSVRGCERWHYQIPTDQCERSGVAKLNLNSEDLIFQKNVPVHVCSGGYSPVWTISAKAS